MVGTQGPTYSPVEMMEEEKVEMLPQKKPDKKGHRIKLTLGLVCGLALLAGMALSSYRINSGKTHSEV